MGAYVDRLTERLAPSSVRAQLAALRTLFHWLLVSGHVPSNPAAAVRGPGERVCVGARPAVPVVAAHALPDAIDAGDVVDLRDRALIAILVYTHARVAPAIRLRVRDYYMRGRRAYLRLVETGGGYTEAPVPPRLQECLDEYLEAAGGAVDEDGPLLRGGGRERGLGQKPLTFQTAKDIVMRRCREAGLPEGTSPHSLRGTGVGSPAQRAATLGRPR